MAKHLLTDRFVKYITPHGARRFVQVARVIAEYFSRNVPLASRK